MSNDIYKIKYDQIVGKVDDPTKRLILLVEFVQNIQYCFSPALSAPEKAYLILEKDGICGSCRPKHYALAYLLTEDSHWRAEYGLPELKVMHLTIPFRFRQMMQFKRSQVIFPDHLPVDKLPEGHHAALQIYDGLVGRDLLIDVTWDPPLARAGFPVTYPWDGRSDMEMCVPWHGEIFMAESLELKLRHLKYLESRPECYTGQIESREELMQILAAINKWLEDIRMMGCK